MTDSWVGGDIGGLRTMAETYKNAKDKLDDVITPVSRAVEALVGDAAWKGEAAETFRATWSEDALTAGAFANLVHDAGDILSDLADALTACETALQNAEHVATGKGVRMAAKGVPQAIVTANPRARRTRRRSPRWASTTRCARRCCTRRSTPGWWRRTSCGGCTPR